MKTKTSVSAKKPTVALRDLKTKKNPKGGGRVGGGSDTLVGGSGTVNLGTAAKVSGGTSGRG
jgi:hypothetical protein